MPLLIPQGLTGDTKTPRVVSETRYGEGPGNIGAFPRPGLLAGYKLGSNLADYEIFPILNANDAIALATETSELAGMIEVATKTPGVLGKLYGMAIPQPAGGAAATATITFTGTATKDGFLVVYLDEKELVVSLPTGTTATVAGDRVEAAVAAVQNAFCSGANDAGEVTLTTAHAAARANEHVLDVDKTYMPAGLTVAIAGGTAFGNGAVPFTGGSGADASNLAAILAATLSQKFDYAAWALNEATSIDDVCNQAATKAGPNGIGPENVVFGFNGSQSAASTRSQIGNQVLGQLGWMEGVVHPSKIAAALMAQRMVTEAQPVTSYWGNPNHRFDYQPLYGLRPHRKDSHSPAMPGTTDAALNTGVTPIVTRNGQPVVCRAITMRSLDGANPDYRTLDVSESMVPQRIREDLDNLWTTQHSVANPVVAADPPNGDDAPDGVSTPTKWRRDIQARLAIAQRELLLIDTTENPAEVEYNPTLKCLIANVPTKVAPLNHITGIVVRQIPA